jgi:hypothetical protein
MQQKCNFSGTAEQAIRGKFCYTLFDHQFAQKKAYIHGTAWVTFSKQADCTLKKNSELSFSKTASLQQFVDSFFVPSLLDTLAFAVISKEANKSLLGPA